MKKSIMYLIGLLLLSSFALQAQPEAGKAPFGRMGGVKKILKLTPDQEKKFDDITYKQQQESIDIHAKIQKNQLELKKMLSDNKVDGNAVLQLTDENSKLQGDLKHGAVKRALDIYSILNDDQKPVWAKMMLKAGAAMKMKGNFARGAMMGMMKGRGMMKGQRMHQAPDSSK